MKLIETGTPLKSPHSPQVWLACPGVQLELQGEDTSDSSRTRDAPGPERWTRLPRRSELQLLTEDP